MRNLRSRSIRPQDIRDNIPRVYRSANDALVSILLCDELAHPYHGKFGSLLSAKIWSHDVRTDAGDVDDCLEAVGTLEEQRDEGVAREVRALDVDIEGLPPDFWICVC